MSLSIQFEDEGIPGFLLRERAPVEQREEQPCNGSIATALVSVWDRAKRLTALLWFGDEDEQMRNGGMTESQEDALAAQIAMQGGGRARIAQPIDSAIPDNLHKALDSFRVVRGELAMHSLLMALAEQSADRLRAYDVKVSTSVDVETLRGKLKEASGAAHYWKKQHDDLKQGEPAQERAN